MSVEYVKAVYSDACRLPGMLRPLAALIAHVVVDERAAAKKPGVRARTFYHRVEKIADMLAAHPKTIRRQLHDLQRHGVLTVAAKGGGRRNFGKGVAGVATTYEFHPDALLLEQAATLHERGKVPALALHKRGRVREANPAQKGEGTPAEPSTNCGGYIGSTELSGSTTELTASTGLTEPVRRRVAADAPHDIHGPAIGRCLTAYSEAFARYRSGKAVVEPGKAGKQMKQLLTAFGEARVLALIDQFFTTADARVVRSDYTVGALFSLAQHLNIGPRPSAQLVANIDAAARACGRR